MLGAGITSKLTANYLGVLQSTFPMCSGWYDMRVPGPARSALLVCGSHTPKLWGLRKTLLLESNSQKSQLQRNHHSQVSRHS